MFKNLTIFRVTSGLPDTAAAVEALLAAMPFAPCGPTAEHSAGFVPPREPSGDLVEVVDGHMLLRVAVETKSVPSSEVKKKAEQAAAQIEEATGRRPGRKEMQQIREDMLLMLLPQAFQRRIDVPVWIDRAAGLLAVGSAASALVDDVLALLCCSIQDLRLDAVSTELAPASIMQSWLLDGDLLDDDDRHGFSVGRDCELHGYDEEKPVVRFQRHHLLTDEVRKHITEGKLPTRLALEWRQQVAFVLCAGPGLTLRRVEFLEGAIDGRSDDVDAFDADAAIATGTLRLMLPDLFTALGGLVAAETEEGNKQ